MAYRLVVLLLATVATFVHSTQSEQFFTSDGLRIRFVDQGEGEPIVLIHGLLSSLDDWRKTTTVVENLARDHRVIALDLRGHGQSDKPRDPAAYGVRLTEDVLRLLDHLKIDRAHIVGYSYGGAVMAKLLVTHPERFASAILGGSAARQRGTAEDVKAAESQAAGFLSDPPLREAIARMAPKGEPLSETQTRERSRQIIGTNDPQALAAFVRGGVSLAVSESDLRAVRVPLLAIVGSNDPALRGVNELKALVPAMSVTVIDGGVHIISEEHGTPRFPEFVEAIRAFVKAHPTRR